MRDLKHKATLLNTAMDVTRRTIETQATVTKAAANLVADVVAECHAGDPPPHALAAASVADDDNQSTTSTKLKVDDADNDDDIGASLPVLRETDERDDENAGLTFSVRACLDCGCPRPETLDCAYCTSSAAFVNQKIEDFDKVSWESMMEVREGTILELKVSDLMPITALARDPHVEFPQQDDMATTTIKAVVQHTIECDNWGFDLVVSPVTTPRAAVDDDRESLLSGAERGPVRHEAVWRGFSLGEIVTDETPQKVSRDFYASFVFPGKRLVFDANDNSYRVAATQEEQSTPEEMKKLAERCAGQHVRLQGLDYKLFLVRDVKVIE